MELQVEPAEPAEPAANATPPMFQMMDNDQNSWQPGQAGSYATDIGGDEEVLLDPTSLSNFDQQPSEGESRQLSIDPDASSLYSDLEDDRFQRLPELIEMDIANCSWEFIGGQFRGELNGNTHASSEPWKNFPVAGDGDVETAQDPGNVGMRSHTTQDPSPKRNHATAANIAQNLVPLRNQQKVDGEKKTGKRHRCPDWTLKENKWFLQYMEVEVQKGKPPWKAISDSLKALGFNREAKACEDHWGVLLANLKKFEKHFGSDDILQDLRFWPSVGTMSREQRSQNRLPLVFEEEWFEAIARIVKKRCRKHRKCRRERFNGRIHIAGTPASSSCRHQSGVCATPSSEISDYPVGYGDGISGLVELLSFIDGNATVDQILEARRISLEAQKMDLRRQEIELERDRMYAYQGH